ncbi:UvrD-helicase domain-containing protein [Acinetobacter gerneri]|uniref:UvrD-helicase domain-containing protein n=1 Tax=Acinetobacter gerneri TaxID=202952 RepID=UPI003A8A32EB
MNIITNPAEQASIKSLIQIQECINNRQSFRLEAGAGAGKTYSLIESLKYIIKNKSSELADKRVACITYTNIAKNEILNRTDNHPLVYADTIHAFCWELIQPFQVNLRNILADLDDKWRTKVQTTPITNQIVKYDLGIMKLTETEVFLHHDDVTKCMSKLLQFGKFQKHLKNKFPIIFIDEYQDTDKYLANSFITYLIENNSGVLVGFFGDHWQKIYGKDACGLIKSPSGKIVEIEKNANFRSDKNIVACLNRIRDELPQNERNPNSKGIIKIFHSNNWNGERQTANHWKGDLPTETAKEYFDQVKIKMLQDGWDLSNAEKTKILFLTNNLIATEQGFKNLADCFKYSDDYLKKSDPYIKFFLDILEPSILAFNEKNFGNVFQILGQKKPNLKCQSDKGKWAKHFDELTSIRQTSTIQNCLNKIKEANILSLPSSIQKNETKFAEILTKTQKDKTDKDIEFQSKYLAFKAISYDEVIQLGEYIEEKTPFSTKHGVKGAEFDNVLVIFGRGWNQYDWEKLLLWMKNGIPNGEEEKFEKYRNLFYVCCSRAKHNLTLLFTQLLSEDSISQLEAVFSADNVLGDPFN